LFEHLAQHAECVDAWLRRARVLSPAEFRDAFQRAFEAVCTRACGPLGVTLTAVLERVLENTHRQFPTFRQPPKRTLLERYDLRASLEATGHARATRAARFVLIELLTVLGRLTAEILTPPLHAELWRFQIRQPATKSHVRQQRLSVGLREMAL
jgi:hypothetical protein